MFSNVEFTRRDFSTAKGHFPNAQGLLLSIQRSPKLGCFSEQPHSIEFSSKYPSHKHHIISLFLSPYTHNNLKKIDQTEGENWPAPPLFSLSVVFPFVRAPLNSVLKQIEIQSTMVLSRGERKRGRRK